MNRNKIFTLFLVITILTLVLFNTKEIYGANTKDPGNGSGSIEEFFLLHYKELKLQKSISNVPALKSCFEKDDQDSVSICVSGVISTLSEKDKSILLKGLTQELRTDLVKGSYNDQLKKYLTQVVMNSLISKSEQKPELLKNLITDQESFLYILERILVKQLFFDIADFCHNDLVVELTSKTAKECLSKLNKPCELGKTAQGQKTPDSTSTCLVREKLVKLNHTLKELKKSEAWWTDYKKNESKGPRLKLDYSFANQLLNSDINYNAFNQLTSKELMEFGYGMNDKKKDTESNQGPETNLSTKRLGEDLLRLETILDLKIGELKDPHASDKNKLTQNALESGLFSEKELADIEKLSADEIKNKIEEKYQAKKIAIRESIDSKISLIKKGHFSDQKNYELELKRKENVIILSNYLAAASTQIKDSSQNTNASDLPSDDAGFKRELANMMNGANGQNVSPNFKAAFEALSPNTQGNTDNRNVASKKNITSDQLIMRIDPKTIEQLLNDEATDNSTSNKH